MRPAIFKKDTTWTWDIRLSNASGAVNGDANPTITVYKAGVPTGESVTVTKPAATTGWYQCSFDPAGEAEHDVYGFAENVTISGVAQPPFHWHAVVVLAERGSDTAPATPTNVSDAQTAILAKLPAALISGRIDASVGAYQSGLTPPTVTQIRTEIDSNSSALQAIASSITALNNLSAKANIFGSLLLEIPDSGNRVYLFELVVKDDEDKLVALDSTPSLTLVNASGTDRSALITATSTIATGRYGITITIASSSTNETLKLAASGTVSGEARFAVIMPQIVDYDSATQINTILTRIGIPSVTVSNDIASVSTKIGTPVTSVAADIAAVKTDTGNLVTRITSTLFTGITSLADWVRRISRKDAGTAGMTTAQTEINTGGTATFAGTTDSLEAISDSATAGAGDASQTTLLQVKAKTDLIGTAQGNTSLIAAAVLAPGTITGFPSELIIGDSYDADTGDIEVSILDSEGDPITSIGSLALVDADIEFIAYRTGDPESKWITGVCTYASSVVSIILPSSETSKGVPEFTYEGRLKFIWISEDAQKTFKTTQFKFVENP